jgi:hypothetical protein
MRSDIVPGVIFSDYELPDHTGKVRKLSELQGDVHADRHDFYRRPPHAPGVSSIGRSRMDLPFGPRPNHSEGSRHPGVRRLALIVRL